MIQRKHALPNKHIITTFKDLQRLITSEYDYPTLYYNKTEICTIKVHRGSIITQKSLIGLLNVNKLIFKAYDIKCVCMYPGKN